MVSDSDRVKSAELSESAKRECINKEWCKTLVGTRVQSWAHRKLGSVSTKSGVRLLWVKSEELSPWTMRECKHKGGARLW